MARIQKLKSEQGQPIETLKSGDDVRRAVGSLYEYGRSYPTGKRPHDYPKAKGIPYPQPSSPSWESERASYRQPTKNSPVSPAPSEDAVQFTVDKTADHVDVPVSDWTRSGTHPHFDHSPPRSKERR